MLWWKTPAATTWSCHCPHGARMVPPPPSWGRGHGWGNAQCFLSPCGPMACCNSGRMFYLWKGCKVSCLFCNIDGGSSPTAPQRVPARCPRCCPSPVPLTCPLCSSCPLQGVLSLSGCPAVCSSSAPRWAGAVGPMLLGCMGHHGGSWTSQCPPRVGTVGCSHPEAGASPWGSWGKPVCRLR